jgi:hypothetical protein
VTGGKAGTAVLRVGDRIRFDGVVQTVVGLSGTLVRLADEHGQTSVIRLPHLLTDPSFEPIGQRDPGPLLPAGALSMLPTQTLEEAEWWERHVVEVLTGLPPDAPPDAWPQPPFDPQTRTLRQREQAKAAELAGLGHQGITARTVKRKRLRYQAQGLAGLVDWRDAPRHPVQGRTDPRVLEALGQAIEEATERSTRTTGYFYWRVAQLLAAQHGAGVVPMPSRATFYRLFDRLSQGRHTTGSARTRRSLANRPDGPFSELTAARPGELVQIDSTPLDVLVLLDKGVPDRVELTGTVDVATRSIPAAVLRPTTKSVDAALLLARTAPLSIHPGSFDIGGAGGGLAGPLAGGIHHRQGQLGPGHQDLSPAKPDPLRAANPRGEVVAGHDVPRAQIAVGVAVQDDLDPKPATGPGPFDGCCPRQRHAAAAGGVGGALHDRDPGDLCQRPVQRGANVRRHHGLQHAVDQEECPVLDGVADGNGCACGVLDQLVDGGEQPVGVGGHRSRVGEEVPKADCGADAFRLARAPRRGQLHPLPAHFPGVGCAEVAGWVGELPAVDPDPVLDGEGLAAPVLHP